MPRNDFYVPNHISYEPEGGPKGGPLDRNLKELRRGKTGMFVMEVNH